MDHPLHTFFTCLEEYILKLSDEKLSDLRYNGIIGVVDDYGGPTLLSLKLNMIVKKLHRYTKFTGSYGQVRDCLIVMDRKNSRTFDRDYDRVFHSFTRDRFGKDKTTLPMRFDLEELFQYYPNYPFVYRKIKKATQRVTSPA